MKVAAHKEEKKKLGDSVAFLPHLPHKNESATRINTKIMAHNKWAKHLCKWLKAFNGLSLDEWAMSKQPFLKYSFKWPT